MKRLFLRAGFFSFVAVTMVCGGLEPLPDKAVQQVAPACDPRWYISIGGGIDIDYQATDFVSGTDFTLESTTPPSTVPQHERYERRTYDDVFGDALYRVQGEIGYVLASHLEIFGLFKYSNGHGGQFTDIDVQPHPPNLYPIGTDFGDYESWGGELGLRYFFFARESSEAWRVRPYISLSGGATAVNSISVEARYLSNQFAPVVPSSALLPSFAGKLYDDSIVGTGAAMLGLEVPVACHWAFGIEGGVRYESELDSTDVIRRTITDYDVDRASARSFHYRVGSNAEHFNSDGARLYCPANVYLKFRF